MYFETTHEFLLWKMSNKIDFRSAYVTQFSINTNQDYFIPHVFQRGGRRGTQGPPIIFTEALVFKSGSTRKFSFQEVVVEPSLTI